MKKLNFKQQLNLNTFITLLSKGYSGGGDDKYFTITSISGKSLKEPLVVPQLIMQLYNLHIQTKTMLEQELKNWK